MKKYWFTALVILGLAVIFTLTLPDSVNASAALLSGSAGSWTWDDETVNGTIIPQYQLTAGEDDYAVPQSNGLVIDGAARICHPYPNGQFGWTAEIRMLTSSGWQAVPTVNAWVPDEEGQYMTCANVWYRGTYAVFGYWEKPDGWMSTYCATVPENYSYYSGPVNKIFHIPADIPADAETIVRCALPGDPGYAPGAIYVYIEGVIDMAGVMSGGYCGCGNLYLDPSFFNSVPE